MPILSPLVKSFLITFFSLFKKKTPVFYWPAAAGRICSVTQPNTDSHLPSRQQNHHAGSDKSCLNQCHVSSCRHKEMPKSQNKALVYQCTMLPCNTLPDSHSDDFLNWLLVSFAFSSSMTVSSLPGTLLWLSKCCNANRRKAAAN